MANSRVPALSALAAASTASTDVVYVVDVSDTTDDPTGSSFKMILSELALAIIAHGAIATDAEVAAGYQPLDSDLTAIAALSTTSFGRGVLALADAAALRTTGGLVIGTDVEAHDTDLTTIAALTPTNDDFVQRKAGAWSNRTVAQVLTDLAAAGTTFQPLDSDLTAIAALSTTSTGRSLLAAADAAAIRVVAGAVIGTNVQAWDADLDAIAALTSAADKVPYSTGAQAWAVAAFTSVARTFTALTTLLAQQQLLSTQAINAQVGTTYTLVAADSTKLVTLSNASAITLTVPQDSDATWAIGDYCEGYQLGAGQVTVAAGTGATLRVSGLTAKARAQYSRFFLQKVSANTWSLAGDLAAS